MHQHLFIHTGQKIGVTLQITTRRKEKSKVHCFCRFEHCLQFLLSQNLTLHLLMRQTWSVRSLGKAAKLLSMEESGGVVVSESCLYTINFINCIVSVGEQSTSIITGRKKSTAQRLSFECSQHRISPTDSKDRTTLISIINSTTEKCFSGAFI